MATPVITKGPFKLDGIPGHYYARCPGCDWECIVDPDQYAGRVSMQCQCGYHETHDLRSATKPKEI